MRDARRSREDEQTAEHDNRQGKFHQKLALAAMIFEEFNDSRMIPFLSKSKSIFAIIGFGVDVSSVSKERFENFEVAIGSGGEKRGVTVSIPIIWFSAVFEKPFRDFGMATSNGSRQRRVAATVC